MVFFLSYFEQFWVKKKKIISFFSFSFPPRVHEQELVKRHEREMMELSVAHSRDTQNMLSDFNKAQEVLKDKISALQILYVLPGFMYQYQYQ